MLKKMESFLVRHGYTALPYPPNPSGLSRERKNKRERDMELIEGMDDRPLTSLQVSIERFDMHNVADSSPDNHHLSTVRFPNTDYSSKTPVREVCITYSKCKHETQSTSE